MLHQYVRHFLGQQQPGSGLCPEAHGGCGGGQSATCRCICSLAVAAPVVVHILTHSPQPARAEAMRLSLYSLAPTHAGTQCFEQSRRENGHGEHQATPPTPPRPSVLPASIPGCRQEVRQEGFQEKGRRQQQEGQEGGRAGWRGGRAAPGPRHGPRPGCHRLPCAAGGAHPHAPGLQQQPLLLPGKPGPAAPSCLAPRPCSCLTHLTPSVLVRWSPAPSPCCRAPAFCPRPPSLCLPHASSDCMDDPLPFPTHQTHPPQAAPPTHPTQPRR